MESKVRFAPSPTGQLHIGGLRTALYNYLYSKKVNGKIGLRIEDTDQTRKVENAVENLLSTFDHMKLKFDEGPNQTHNKDNPYFQSNRLDIYKKHVQQLLKSGNAYPCFCSTETLAKKREKQANNKQTIKYDRHCLKIDSKIIDEKMANETHVIRMKIPSNKQIFFYDMVRDKISINSEEIDDQIIIKSDGYPTYHFANVIDDHLMKITHVMRGEEWLPSTPKHIILYDFFDWDLPKFIHLPLLLNKDRSKLSKRQGDVAVEDYLKKGFLPEAIINFVVLLGWNPKNEKEFFTLDELTKEFSIKNIQKSGAIFDIKKLKWINSYYLKNKDVNEIAKLAKSFFINKNIDISNDKKFLSIINYVRQRVHTLEEMPVEAKMFYEEISFSPEQLKIINNHISQKLLKMILSTLKNEPNCDANRFKQIAMESGEKLNLKGKDLFHPLRIALYGKPDGPDIPIIYSILEKNEIINRLLKVVNG